MQKELVKFIMHFKNYPVVFHKYHKPVNYYLDIKTAIKNGKNWNGVEKFKT